MPNFTSDSGFKAESGSKFGYQIFNRRKK